MEEEIKKEEVQEKTLEEKLKEGQALDKMTAPELREIAIGIEGVAGVHAMKKGELLRIIKAARGIPDEEKVKRAKKEKAKALTVKELKAKARKFRVEKAAAREAKDPKRVNLLRRRINRLKKRTKKVVEA
jgi:hypothetical protein